MIALGGLAPLRSGHVTVSQHAHAGVEFAGCSSPSTLGGTVRYTAAAAVFVIGVAVAGCASGTSGSGGDDGKPSTPGPGSVAAWYGQGGTTLTRQIGTDLTAISAAAPDATRMAPACTQLGRDATAAGNYPPIPDTQAQQHWAAALADLTATATACTSGDVAQADEDIRQASLHMQQLTTRVDQLDGT
jgi:hypothetical protein